MSTGFWFAFLFGILLGVIVGVVATLTIGQWWQNRARPVI